MLLFIIILIIFYLWLTDAGSSNAENNQSDQSTGQSNHNHVKKNVPQKKQSRDGRLDTRINGLDLAAGDIVRLKNSKTYKIMEVYSNGVYLGKNMNSDQELKLYVPATDYFILKHGIYTHEQYVLNNKNKSSTSKQVNHSWKDKNYPDKTRFMLRINETDQTYAILSKITIYDKITLEREGKNIIRVYNSDQQLLGTVPHEIANSITRKMDNGIIYDAKIIRAFGHKGLEILIWKKAENKKQATQNTKTIHRDKQLNLDKERESIVQLQEDYGIKTKLPVSKLKIGDTIRLDDGKNYVIKERQKTKSGKNYRLTLLNIDDGSEVTELLAHFYKLELVRDTIAVSKSRSHKSSSVKTTIKSEKREGNVDTTSTNPPKKPVKQTPKDTMITKLSGVTFEGRQNIIANLLPQTKIYMEQDYHNSYDKNAIGVFIAEGIQIGWIPANLAKELAPKMDDGSEYTAKIRQILGGNEYNYGVEIEVSQQTKTKSKKGKTSHQKQKENKLENARLTVSSTSISENTILVTYNNTLLKVPYQIKLESTRRPNPTFGNAYDFTIVELNTGLGKTISQEEVLSAIQVFRQDYDNMGLFLFAQPDFFLQDRFAFVKFSIHNKEYYRKLLIKSGFHNPTDEQVVQASLLEIKTLLAETIAVTFEKRLGEAVMKVSRKNAYKTDR